MVQVYQEFCGTLLTLLCGTFAQVVCHLILLRSNEQTYPGAA